MMPCNLIVTGKDFDIDSFIAKSKLRGFVKKYKGEPMFKSKPGGKKLERSRTGIQTSKADFDDLNKQIKDTIGYLKRHKDKLSHIKKKKELNLQFWTLVLLCELIIKQLTCNRIVFRMNY